MKQVTITVAEIANGFLITKTTFTTQCDTVQTLGQTYKTEQLYVATAAEISKTIAGFFTQSGYEDVPF